ncbi:MAG TPA: hypothetical protein VMV40_09115 [Acidiferrobacter sp.]|nr:hypothetical protein [Acidiferrobacter sp.]
MKLNVMFQRIEAKDYRDIAAILASGVMLAEGMAAARCLFGKEFQPAECLRTLVYFQGRDLETPEQKDRRILVEAVSRVRDLPDAGIVGAELSLPELRR